MLQLRPDLNPALEARRTQRACPVRQNDVVKTRLDGKNVHTRLRQLLKERPGRYHIFFAFEEFLKNCGRKAATAAQNLAENELVLSIPVENFGKASKTTGQVTSEKQHLIFRTDSFGIIGMSAKPRHRSHPGGMSDVETVQGPLANFFMRFTHRAIPDSDAVALENQHAAAEQVDVWMPLQVLNLALETLGISNIIGVHSRKVFSAAHGNGLIQARHKAFVGLIGEHRNTGIKKLRATFESSVARTILYQQQFPVAIGLIQN